MPKPFNPDAKVDEVDVVLKEGNLLTNVYNRVLRTLFYTIQSEFDGKVPYAEISSQIKEECKNAILNYERFMAEKKFHQVINVVDVFVRNINKYYVKEIKTATDKESIAKIIANTMLRINKVRKEISLMLRSFVLKEICTKLPHKNSSFYSMLVCPKK